MSYFGVVNDVSIISTITNMGDTIPLVFTGHSSASFAVSGTWTGTLIAEGSIDGSAWAQVWIGTVTNSLSLGGFIQPIYSITSTGTDVNGFYRLLNTQGITQIRIRALSQITGQADITLTAVAAPPTHIFTNSAIIQNGQADPNNGTIVPLTSGTPFVGIATPTLGISGIQISMKADQNSTIYVDQSIGLVAGTGSVTTAGTTALVGSGTLFQTTFAVGDEIYVEGETGSRIIDTIGNNTHLTVTVPFTTSAGSLTYQGYHWDITDSFTYLATTPFGMTVKSIGAYLRVRIGNTSSVPQTYLRMQTFLCPISEVVPRSLDLAGNLKTATQSVVDSLGFNAFNTPQGELRTVIPCQLAGTAFDLDGNTGVPDNNFWVVDTSGGATVEQALGLVTLCGGTAATTHARLYSKTRARYISGYSNKFHANITQDAATTGNARKWGVAYGATMPTLTDGLWFAFTDTVFSVNVSLDDAPTPILSGAFNGALGMTWAPIAETTYTYEIIWDHFGAWFLVNGVLLHRLVEVDGTPLTATLAMYIYTDNVNSSGQNPALNMYIRDTAIHRLGPASSSPTYYHIAGVTAGTGVQLKVGPGRLHKIILNSVGTGTTVSLYDSPDTAANPIALIAPTGANAPALVTPLEYNLEFANGLWLVTAGASTDATIVYE